MREGKKAPRCIIAVSAVGTVLFQRVETSAIYLRLVADRHAVIDLFALVRATASPQLCVLARLAHENLLKCPRDEGLRRGALVIQSLKIAFFIVDKQCTGNVKPRLFRESLDFCRRADVEAFRRLFCRRHRRFDAGFTRVRAADRQSSEERPARR